MLAPNRGSCAQQVPVDVVSDGCGVDDPVRDDRVHDHGQAQGVPLVLAPRNPKVLEAPQG